MPRCAAIAFSLASLILSACARPDEPNAEFIVRVETFGIGTLVGTHELRDRKLAIRQEASRFELVIPLSAEQWKYLGGLVDAIAAAKVMPRYENPGVKDGYQANLEIRLPGGDLVSTRLSNAMPTEIHRLFMAMDASVPQLSGCTPPWCLDDEPATFSAEEEVVALAPPEDKHTIVLRTQLAEIRCPIAGIDTLAAALRSSGLQESRRAIEWVAYLARAYPGYQPKEDVFADLLHAGFCRVIDRRTSASAPKILVRVFGNTLTEKSRRVFAFEDGVEFLVVAR